MFDLYETFLLLEDIEKTSSLNEKTRRLQTQQQNPYIKQIFNLTYNPHITFNITVPEVYGLISKVLTSTQKQDLPKNWEEFIKITDRLKERQITGNAARNEVTEFLNKVSQLEKKWYSRVLNRELKIGISESLIKKLWPTILPPIHVMLASPLSNTVKIQDTYYYVEPKYDGVRNIFMVNNGILQIFSRNGRRFERVESFIQSKISLPGSWILDSECFVDTWNRTTSILFNESSDYEHLKFFIFDIVPYDVYMKKGHTLPLQDRKKQLNEYLDSIKYPQFFKTPSLLLKDADVIQATFNKYLEQGYEGSVIKEADSPYVYKRSKYWIKLKQRDFDTYLCIGVERGTGKWHDALGSIVVKKDNVVFKVGSGFSDQDRIYYWKNQNEIIGKCVEISSFPSGAKSAKASFPVFIRIRADVEC